MHVTKKKSDANPNTFSNARIDELNRRLAALADNKKIFFLNFVSVFDDSTGNMSTEYSGDGVHLYAKCYKLWRDWILENGKIY
jgi:lysophospholipase L1-like esterase